MRLRKTAHLDDALLVRVCELFLEGKKTTEIARWVNRMLGHSDDDPDRVTREQVYQFLEDARRQHFLELVPPSSTINGRIAARHGLDADRISVVSAVGATAHEYVASHAARLLLRLILKLDTRRRSSERAGEVHVGLGAGWTTRTVAYHLAKAMREERTLPRLVLHALSCGVDVEQPQTSPISFFGYFDDIPHEVEYVGLFASPIVESDHYEALKRDAGVADALKRKGEIDIIVTALASEGHEHFGLNRMLERYPEDVEFLRARRWVGDVQYRPFSNWLPIEEEAKHRVVTLFELPELVQLACQPEKYVIVAAGPCHCGHTRHRAIRPLLTSPSLKLWTHLVLDLDTASELVAD